jgi:predicted DNA-binding transcriptional regulator AlpA
MGKSMSAADHLRLMTSDRAELEPLLTAREVAHILGVRDKRVYELGIPAVRLSERSLRWRPSDVQRWIEERSRM